MGRVLVGKPKEEVVEVIVKKEDLPLLEGLPMFRRREEIYPNLFVVVLVGKDVLSKLKEYAKKKKLKIVKDKLPVKGEITIDE